MADDYLDVSQWQFSTTWVYFPCTEEYWNRAEQFERAIENIDSLTYAMYHYHPAIPPTMRGILLAVYHPLDSDTSSILAIARGDLVSYRNAAAGVFEAMGPSQSTIYLSLYEGDDTMNMSEDAMMGMGIL
ncbi:hypothetical protein AbraIFM66950_007160 [Aspergillus brasiliensis]|nr:hypothetical protein AbraIFM66950_007160 [Aspergillus brasiliensis]